MDRTTRKASSLVACNPERGTMTVRFGEVRMTRKLSDVKCTGCGKKLRRTVEAYQTVNPYNLNKDGRPKSEDEIRAELPAELDAAERSARKTAVCPKCRE